MLAAIQDAFKDDLPDGKGRVKHVVVLSAFNLAYALNGIRVGGIRLIGLLNAQLHVEWKQSCVQRKE